MNNLSGQRAMSHNTNQYRGGVGIEIQEKRERMKLIFKNGRRKNQSSQLDLEKDLKIQVEPWDQNKERLKLTYKRNIDYLRKRNAYKSEISCEGSSMRRNLTTR